MFPLGAGLYPVRNQASFSDGDKGRGDSRVRRLKSGVISALSAALNILDKVLSAIQAVVELALQGKQYSYT